MEDINSIELRVSTPYVLHKPEKSQKKQNKVVEFISRWYPFFATLFLFKGIFYVLSILFLMHLFIFFTLEFLFNYGDLSKYRLFNYIKGPSSGHAFYSLSFVFSPIFGVLADRYIGRYKIISFGMITLFVSSCAFILFFLTTHHIHVGIETEPYTIGFSIIITFYVIGLSSLLPLLLPYGVDQMEGASEQSLKSYFTWFFGVLNLSAFFSYLYYVGFTDVQGISLYHIDKKNLNHIVYILITGSLVGTFAVFIAIVLHKFLIETKRLIAYSPSGDPLGMIWRITLGAFRKYSLRKQPSVVRQMQYFEGSQKLLDFAKTDDLNTFEHVENVKTFFRIIPLLLALIPYFAVTTISTGSYIEQNIYLFDRFEDATVIPQLIDPLTIIILVLIFEFNPVKKRFKFSSILQRVYIGVLFALASLICSTIVEFISTFVNNPLPTDHTTPLINITSPLLHPDRTVDNVKLLLFKITFQIPQFLLMGISEFLAVIGTFEFIYAQSPQEMKCFIYGLFQCIRGLGFLTPFIVHKIIQASTCRCALCTCDTCATYNYLCKNKPTMVAYTYLVGSVLFTVYVVALAFFFKNYKKRQRQPREVWYQ